MWSPALRDHSTDQEIIVVQNRAAWTQARRMDRKRLAPTQSLDFSHPLAAGLHAGVRTAIGAQCVFYMAPAVMAPSLFLQVQSAVWSTGEKGSGWRNTLSRNSATSGSGFG